MFKRLDDKCGSDTRFIHFSFEGGVLTARPGETVATALLANGVNVFRNSAVSGGARGPYCLMGVCFECLVSIDGAENQQACLRVVEDGMQVVRQRGAVTLAGLTGGEGAAS